MKKRVIIIVSLLFILCLVGVGVWITKELTQDKPQPGDIADMTSDDTQLSDENKQPDTSTSNSNGEIYSVDRSESELNKFIVQSQPTLVNNRTNLPIFSIVSETEPMENWYVVTIRNNETDTSDAQIVIHDINGTLTTVAGPGTGLHTIPNLPDAVRKALE